MTLVILAVCALYIPAVQDAAVRYASQEASTAMGMQVQVGQIRLGFPLNITLKRLSVARAPGDTLLAVGQARLDIGLAPLLAQQIYTPSFHLQNLRLNYTDSTGLSNTQVELSELTGRELSVDLTSEEVHIGLLRTEGLSAHYRSTDTVPTPDEPQDTIRWRIRADLLELLHSEVSVDMPLDSLVLESQVGSLKLNDGQIDLASMNIELGRSLLERGRLTYAQDHAEPATNYLDYGHIIAENITLGISDVHAQGDQLRLQIDQGLLSERSGLQLNELRGEIELDSLGIVLSSLTLRTQYSSLMGQVHLPWNILSGDTTALVEVNADGSIAAEDIRSLTGQQLLSIDEYSGYDASLRKAKLTNPIDFGLNLRGTLSDLEIGRIQLLWEDVLDLKAEGRLQHLTLEQQRRGRIRLEGSLQHRANSLLSLASPQIAQTYNLPSGLTLKGAIDLGGGQHHFDLKLGLGLGEARLVGDFIERSERYRANLSLRALDLKKLMPHGSLGLVSADLELSGRGVDPMHQRSHSDMKLRINHLAHDRLSLQDITLDGNLKAGALYLSLNSFNPGLNLALQGDALLGGKTTYGSIILDAQEIDLQALGMSQGATKAQFRLTGEMRTNMQDEYKLTTLMEDVILNLDGRKLTPKEVSLVANVQAKSSEINLTSGDLKLRAQTNSGLDGLSTLGDKLGRLSTELLEQIESSRPMQLRLEDLLAPLPESHLAIEMGTENALKDYLAEQRIALGSFEGHLNYTPEAGLSGAMHLADLRQDTLRLNRIDLTLSTLHTPRREIALPAPRRSNKRRLPVTQRDSLALAIEARIQKNPYRAQDAFDLQAQLTTTLQQARLALQWLDAQQKPRHRANLLAGWDGSHYYLHIPDTVLLLGYQKLRLNRHNHIAYNKGNNFFRSDLRLAGERSTLLSLQAADSIPGVQDVHLTIQHLRLEDFRSLGLPDVAGTIFGDIKYMRHGDIHTQPVITGDVSAQNLRYGDKKLGHFATALFYEPRNDQSHYITAEVSYRGNPALAIDGIYHPKRTKAPLEGTLHLSDFPLEIGNPFLSSLGVALAGTIQGQLSLSGALTSPDISGTLKARDGQIDLNQYAAQIKLDSIPLRLEQSTLYLDNYTLRSGVDADHPLYIDGSVVALGPRATQTNLSIKTNEMVLLNQSRPKRDDQLLYGRLIASSDMRITGRADALKVRGKLSVLGGTNCTYIMREGPLEANDRMSELVSFVDFSDTLFVKAPVETTSGLGGLDLNLALHFDPSVRFGVDLTADGQDYMRMQGGGSMQFSYPPYGQMSLIGRYEMSGGGKLHYTMPIVGGKLFSIDPSGYILFEGDVTNPLINFKATQTVKAATGEGKGAQKTNFVVSIKAEDRINDVKLGFDLSAPENLSVQNALSAMSQEERGKQAIGLLATGVYLAGSKGGADFNFDSALTSLLQSQINRAAGSLLQGTDLDIGMEVHDGKDGGKTYTDYTYSFSRRFYNDRIRVVVGGKIQSGNVPTNQEQTLIDNVALEYQLDQAGEQYLRLYHKRITDNILEGEYTETGGGYLIRRKLSHPWELFHFGRRKQPRPSAADSISTRPWQGIPFALPSAPTSLKPQD